MATVRYIGRGERGQKNITTGYQNQKIEILSSDSTPLPAGGSDPGVSVYWDTSAQIRRLGDYRNSQGNVSEIQFQYEVKVRYRDDKNIQNNMILKWRGAYWVIFGYDPDLVYQDYIVFKITQDNPGNLVIPQSLT